ncbi:MAG: TPM domain-containing protein [Lachnospiraceae bacterium]|nr:TPM domain-containing protein [Lachnospiraceae bacterium]
MKKLISLISAIALAFLFVLPASAAEVQEKNYTNETTGYNALVIDEADILSDNEELQLISDMAPLTAYENVMFLSTTRSIGDYGSFSGNTLRTIFPATDASIFLIDMNKRYLFLYTIGSEAQRVLTNAEGDNITDNVYRIARSGDYYLTAKSAYDQMLALFKGQNIARPMKHINNALLAVGIALLISYIIILITSVNNKKAAQKAAFFEGRINNLKITPGRLTRVYNPPSSSSGGGGGGGGGFSGGGGGSGGGHSF